MLNLVLSSLYFILPAYIANTFPVLFKWLPFGNPINEKLFGEHKTYRGLISGTLTGILIVFLQYKYSSYFKGIELMDYSYFSSQKIILIGICFGAGALFGDLIKSFFKRRLRIKDGHSWFPFDQLDFVIGSLIAVSPFYSPPLSNLIIILLITPILHFLTNIFAYLIGLKKVWW
ncbi:MAG: CDP-2,3-bis-(O-geranylgeranyl)-sn-glycerol synthase [Patescibacteria group bacterium]